MAAPSAAPPIDVPKPRRVRNAAAGYPWRVVWSPPAAYRALRATLVIPSLFALTSQVVGNVQMATFTTFGGFATLVLASFGGGRRDKLVAHTVFAVAGSVLIVIGTAVSSSTALAASVTVPLVFCVLFAGIWGPNAASGATAVLVAYLLPAVSAGTMGTVPARLEGWWLASIAGTLAVLTLSPPAPGDRLRAAAAQSAAALADELDVALAGKPDQGEADAAMEAKQALLTAFTSAPYRPTGLATSDEALADLIENLEWCTTLVSDAVSDESELAAAEESDRDLLRQSAGVLRDTALLLRGEDERIVGDDLPVLRGSRGRKESACSWNAAMTDAGAESEEAMHGAFHANIVATAARSAAVDAITASRVGDVGSGRDRTGAMTVELGTIRRTVREHASLRSVWFLNSARGAVALAAAVAVADLTNVQHGFWVALGALSVLRTNAASTGATALRALTGTAVGFFIGAGLILAVGSHTAALWAAFPLAVLVAAYAPGTAPFAVGQAAFTVLLGVLFNILVPVGWKVGVIRLEDVALGAAVSALVGIFFWPRGAGVVVGDDLADAFHRGGVYLVQATAWALGVRPDPPDGGEAAGRAGDRVDVALRAFLAEQGSKTVSKEQLWRLVGGAQRLRLTAQSLAGLPRSDREPTPAGRSLVAEAVRLAGRYDDLAARLGHTPESVARELVGPSLANGPAPDFGGCDLWVRMYLDHVNHDLEDLDAPAEAVAERRALPWWR